MALKSSCWGECWDKKSFNSFILPCRQQIFPLTHHHIPLFCMYRIWPKLLWPLVLSSWDYFVSLLIRTCMSFLSSWFKESWLSVKDAIRQGLGRSYCGPREPVKLADWTWQCFLHLKNDQTAYLNLNRIHQNQNQSSLGTLDTAEASCWEL